MNWPQWNPAIEWPVGLLLAWVFLIALARVLERRDAAWPAERNDNGIRVGAPKVYDNRSLSLMLEQLEAQLKTMQGIDGSAVRAATGTQQGERRSEVTGSLAALFSKMAKASGDGKSKAGEAESDKSAAGKNEAAPPEGQSPFKTSARAVDLLNDQVGLSYEIFNLRLLLERALSDRLQGKDTRLQAVIGVPISLDPPAYATGCAATVELKISKRVSLVALFPQQETFNTWGVDRRRFQLGGSAKAGGSVSGSLGIGKASENSSLQRHADVVAMEREAGREELIVAWQFRPAPGSRTVAAGLRQMLMVVALPDADTGDEPIAIEAFVRSSWQKWRSSSDTASRGAGWRSIWSNRPTHHEWGSHGCFHVPRTEAVEETLRPLVESIEWVRTGRKLATVIVKGRNFFTGTTVVLGDEVLDTDHGLTIKSERSMQLIAPIDSLVYDAVLNGRYGPSMQLVKAPPAQVQILHIVGASIDPSPSGDAYMIELQISTRGLRPPALNWELFSKFPDPILSINGRIVPDPLVFEQLGESGARAWLSVTSEFLKSRSALMILTWPFYGEDWSLAYQTHDPEVRVTASRFSSEEGRVTLLFSGAAFEKDTTVVLDDLYEITDNGSLTLIGEDLLKLELAAEKVNGRRECFICRPQNASLRVPLPDVPAPAEPNLDVSKKPAVVPAKGIAWIEITGTGLDKVTQAKLKDATLSFMPYASGTLLSVLVDASAVNTPGIVEIELATKSGKPLRAPILIS